MNLRGLPVGTRLWFVPIERIKEDTRRRRNEYEVEIVKVGRRYAEVRCVDPDREGLTHKVALDTGQADSNPYGYGCAGYLFPSEESWRAYCLARDAWRALRAFIEKHPFPLLPAPLVNIERAGALLGMAAEDWELK